MTQTHITCKEYRLQGKCRVGTLAVDIENKKGSIRRGVDPDGTKWEIRMPADYGYIKNTEGVDGDEVDCFVGPDRDSDLVFVIHQSVVGNKKKYDEDKVMLGFKNQAAAVRIYKSAYEGVDLLQSVTKLSMDKFCESLKKYEGKKIQAEESVYPVEIDPVIRPTHLTKQQRQIKPNTQEGVKNALREGDPKIPVQTALPAQNTMI